VSNLETDPQVVDSATPAVAVPEVVEPRLVPLGGPRAVTVRRTLPHRTRSLIGAWCFIDHYGPVTDVAMDLPGHPHTALQTVSWLFAGELEHRDTIGSHALIRPGEMNLMTAGRGIAHSEFTTPNTATLHGVQLWVALPDRDRFTEPRFEHHAPEPITVGPAELRVFLGSLMGSTSPVRTSTRLLGAQLTMPPGESVRLDVDPTFEHGVLVDSGSPLVNGTLVRDAHLLYVPPGTPSLTIDSGADPLRALVLGGEPLGERIVMWWNFIARSHDEIVELRSQWQEQLAGGHAASGPYGRFPAQWATVLPAPPLPNARLRPRS
jgi:redox-sensitive bicupin YhaK (pirin superfamily)